MGLLTSLSEEAASVSIAERVESMQHMLVARSRGIMQPELPYQQIRRELMENSDVRERLPSFVRTCGSLAQFWPFIQKKFSTYADRQEFIWQAFRPLLDYLEGIGTAPVDDLASETLASFDEEGVHLVWQKALERRQSDPDGAITTARTLLETVCKRVLDEAGEAYKDEDELPRLYATVAERLSLAPSQHSEKVFKAILGNCQSVVNHLGGLRNKIGDAHGKGGKPVKPTSRHAALAVNLAGAMATFLVETWLEKKGVG